MGAGTKCEAGVEHQIDFVRFWWLLPAGANPQALATANRVIIAHPFALPILILQLFPIVLWQWVTKASFSNCDRFGGIDFCIKQAGDFDTVPERGFAQAGFKDGLVGIVLQSDRRGAASQ